MKAVVWVGVFALTVAVPIEVRVVPDKDSEIKRQIFTWLQREYIANDGDLSKISQQSSPEDFRIESYIYENSIPTFVVTTNDNKRYKIRIKKKDVIRKDVYENLAYIQPEHKVAQSIHSYSSYKFSPAYKTYLEYNEVDVGTPLTEAEVLSIRQSQSTQSGKSTYWVNFGQYFGLDTTKPKDFRIAKDLQLLVTSSKIINQNEEAALANIKAIYDKELRGKDFNVKWDTEGRFNFLKVISKKYIEHPQERDIKLQIKNRGIVKQIFLKTSLEPDDISIVQHPSKENKIKYLTKLSEYVDLDINNPKNIEVLQNLFIILLSELKSNSNMNFKTAALKVKNMYEKEIGRNNFDLKLNNVDGKKYLEIDVKKSVDDNYDIKDDDSHINDDENNDNDTYEDKNNNIDNIDYIKNVDIKNGSDYGNIDDISDDNIENDSDYGKIDNISDDDIKNDSDNVTIDDISDDDIKNDRDNGDIDDISDDEYKINGDKGKIDDSSDDDIKNDKDNGDIDDISDDDYKLNGDKGKIDDSSDDDIKNDRDNGVIDDISDDEYKINGDKSKIDDSSDDDIEKDSKDDNNDYTRDNSYIIGEISDYDGNKDYIETNPLVNYNIEYNNVNNEHIEGDNTGDNDEHYDNNYDSKQKYYNAYTYVIGNKRGVKYKNDVENGYPTPIQDSRPMIDTVEDDSSHSGLYHRSPNNDNTKSIEDRKDIEINGKREPVDDLSRGLPLQGNVNSTIFVKSALLPDEISSLKENVKNNPGAVWKQFEPLTKDLNIENPSDLSLFADFYILVVSYLQNNPKDSFLNNVLTVKKLYEDILSKYPYTIESVKVNGKGYLKITLAQSDDEPFASDFSKLNYLDAFTAEGMRSYDTADKNPFTFNSDRYNPNNIEKNKSIDYGEVFKKLIIPRECNPKVQPYNIDGTTHLNFEVHRSEQHKSFPRTFRDIARKFKIQQSVIQEYQSHPEKFDISQHFIKNKNGTDNYKETISIVLVMNEDVAINLLNFVDEQPKELWWSFYDRLGMDINNEQDNEIFKYLYLIIMSQAMENDSGVVDAVKLLYIAEIKGHYVDAVVFTRNGITFLYLIVDKSYPRLKPHPKPPSQLQPKVIEIPTINYLMRIRKLWDSKNNINFSWLNFIRLFGLDQNNPQDVVIAKDLNVIYLSYLLVVRNQITAMMMTRKIYVNVLADKQYHLVFAKNYYGYPVLKIIQGGQRNNSGKANFFIVLD